MATAAATSPPGGNALSRRQRQWRYTWETLTHLPLLRLYLFHPSVSTTSASHLRAQLRLDDSLLLLSFSLAGDPVSLRLPFPRVLVDPSAPAECRAADDHVEVRLPLVLPVDHPVVAAAFPPPAGTERPAPLDLRKDLKSLSSGDVHLYCKTCSARLTKQPLRHIVEMPSVNWEDVADNWFGGCCCSFGGVSEKLVSQYINTYGRLEETSLLDATSISIKKDFLDSCAFKERVFGSGTGGLVPSNDSVALQEAISGVSGGDHTTEEVKLNNSEEQAYHKHSISSSHGDEASHVISTVENGETVQLAKSGFITLDDDVDVNSPESNVDCCVEKEKLTKETDLLPVDLCHCCSDNGDSGRAENNPSEISLGKSKEILLESQRDLKLAKSISLGSGFIVKASKLSNDIEWVELLCGQCSSPLGSYPSWCSRTPVDGRLRLFKCYISSGLPVGGVLDVFRGHNLERLLVNLLLETAEDEISFRTVVRDLKAKKPILQIVLLSSKVWLFSGYCCENDVDGSYGAAYMRPAVKLLFSDCSNASEADLRIVEEWSVKYRAEELYMMRCQIDELIGYLTSSMDKFPLSCSSLEGMYLSSLAL